MLKRIFVCLFMISLKSQLFASTPTEQVGDFPSIAQKSQKEKYEEYKKSTRPVRNSIAPRPFPSPAQFPAPAPVQAPAITPVLAPAPRVAPAVRVALAHRVASISRVP